MYDVVVLGAGMAGVTAARECERNGLTAVVLEATERIGGRMLTTRDFANAPVECGAEFVHTENADTWTEIKAGQFETLKCNPADGYIMSIGGVGSPDLYQDPSLAQLGDLLSEIAAFDGPDMTAAEFVNRKGLTGVARVMAEQMLTVHPLGDLDQLSMIGIRDDRVVELERGVDWRLTAGYDALPAWIGKNLDVRYETKVDKIQWSESGATAFSTTGEEFPARSVICTAPIGVLKAGAIQFSPDLPTSKWQALNGLEMGSVMKILFRFKERFWDDGLTMVGCDGPVRLYWTPLYGWGEDATPVLIAYVGGYRARALSARTEAEAVAIALADLDRIFPKVLPSQLIEDSQRVDWCTNENTRGGYSFVRVGGSGSRQALAVSDTGALFWAGDGTATESIAAVVHAAYATGLRSAAEVISFLGR